VHTLLTFGDSILDCGRYNAHGVHPGALLVRNDDARFPEFAGQDLGSRGPARLVHRALDGATVEDLPRQLSGVEVDSPATALLTVGGNDLLRGLVFGTGLDLRAFGLRLEAFATALPVRPLLIGNVYDPSLGDDSRNFLPVAPRLAREAHRRLDETIATVAARHGTLVDLHAHFLTGDASWFTSTIEPSLVGASEVRRAFLPYVLAG
jgi:lysophospholipase L1-like esterase